MFRIAAAIALSLLMSSAGNAAWRYSADRDPFTDEIASTASISKPGVFGASLVVRYKDGYLEAYFIPGQYIGNESADVRFRFGKEEIENEVWSASTNGTAVFADRASEFARLAASSSTLAIEVSDFSDTRHSEVFSLAGSSAAIGRVMQNCQIMLNNPRNMDGEIWRRVIQDLDKLSVSDAQFLSDALASDDDAEKLNGRKSLALYRRMSAFWVNYWTVCEINKPKHKFCKQWLDRLERDPDADYPVEVVDLLLTDEREEKVSEVTAS
jgi:hypothetical protein